MKGAIAIVAGILIVILLFIGQYMFPNVDGFIDTLVKDINATFVQVKTNRHIMDAKSYREEGAKGIVLEYRLTKEASEKEFDQEKVKNGLIESLREENVDEIIELGIYFIVIYKNYKDQEIFKFRISSEELNG